MILCSPLLLSTQQRSLASATTLQTSARFPVATLRPDWPRRQWERSASQSGTTQCRHELMLESQKRGARRWLAR